MNEGSRKCSSYRSRKFSDLTRVKRLHMLSNPAGDVLSVAERRRCVRDAATSMPWTPRCFDLTCRLSEPDRRLDDQGCRSSELRGSITAKQVGRRRGKNCTSVDATVLYKTPAGTPLPLFRPARP